MAYKKFDDASTKVDSSAVKVNGAFPSEAIRRALQGVTNRVLGATAGTGYYPTLAVCAIGTTAGFKTTNEVGVVINGAVSKVIAKDNLFFAKLGTMGTNTVAKFLICTKDGTSATCIGNGNIIDKGNYASATLAAAAAKLPDLPDNSCALGYVTLQAPAATVLVLTDAAVTSAASLGYAIGGGGTAGTATYVDLVNMPFNV